MLTSDRPSLENTGEKGYLPQHSLFPTTADIGIEAQAPDFSGLLLQASLALLEVMADPSVVCCLQSLRLEVNAQDRAEIIVAWLNEIVYLYETRGLVFACVEVQEAGANHARGVVRGEPLDHKRHHLRHAVKGVTYHQLRVVEDKEGFRLRVILDI